jgi:uncharacterized membrane protein YhaH (DUF805 family)
MDKTPTQWMVTPLRKYVDFGGRARRKEYWWYILLTGLLATVTLVVDVTIVGFETVALYGSGPLTGLLALALFLPSLGVTIRRLHDHDRSGWWVLLGLLPLVGALVLLYWYATRGTVGANRYGPDPLADE